MNKISQTLEKDIEDFFALWQESMKPTLAEQILKEYNMVENLFPTRSMEKLYINEKGDVSYETKKSHIKKNDMKDIMQIKKATAFG